MEQLEIKTMDETHRYKMSSHCVILVEGECYEKDTERIGKRPWEKGEKVENNVTKKNNLNRLSKQESIRSILINFPYVW